MSEETADEKWARQKRELEDAPELNYVYDARCHEELRRIRFNLDTVLYCIMAICAVYCIYYLLMDNNDAR